MQNSTKTGFRLLEAGDRLVEANSNFLKSIEQRPEDADARCGLAIVGRANRELEESLHCIEKALKLVRGEDRHGRFIPVPPPKGLFDPDDVACFRQIAKDEENYYYKDAAEAGKRT